MHPFYTQTRAVWAHSTRYLGALLLLATSFSAQAQTGGVGIGTTAPDASAALDIVSSSKGALLPRVAAASALATPATGLLVFQTGSPAGFYYNAGTPAAPSWQQLNVVGGAGDNLGNHTATQALNLQGNALTGTGASISGIGVGVRADGGLNLGQNTTGNNVYLGFQAGQANTTGTQNQFSGYLSGYNNTTGSQNQFSGYNSGRNNTTGNNNQFSGYYSGMSNTSGNYNYFSGSLSGYYNTTGNNNYFSGFQSGLKNTTGSSNYFSGYASGTSNTTGSQNQFSGFLSGRNNTTGNANQFSGFQSGYNNTTGGSNQFSGYNSGFSNTTGTQNQFSGYLSGYNTTTGNNNLFSGYASGYNNNTGSNNTALGYNSGPANGSGALTNATALGANVSLTTSNTVVLGNGANVGIGTSTPGQKLEVAGIIYSNTGGFQFPDNTMQTTAATDVQQLSISGSTISLTNGGSITVPSGAGDNLGNHTATQSLKLNGNTLSNNGTGGLTLDNAGNVGIGTASPAGPLQVNGTRAVTSTATVDQMQTSFNGLTYALDAYQSFTAGVSQPLTRVDMNLSSFGASQATFSVYQGAGTGGTLLSSQLIPITSHGQYDYQSIVLPVSVALTSGQVYSLRVQSTNTGQVSFYYSNANPYAGGEAVGNGVGNSGGGVDLLFRTYTAPVTSVQSLPVLTVLASGNVGIGTSSATQPLEVAGTIYSNAGGFRFPDGTTQTTAATAPNLTGDITSSGVSTTYSNVVPTTKGGAGTVSGILKANGSGLVAAAVAADFPTLNQNTTGNAATATYATTAGTVTTNANLTGAITSSGNTTNYNTVVPAAKGGAGTVSGLLKANGSGLVAAAVAGTDYVAPGSGAFVQSQTTTAQSGGFNVAGAGTIGGLLTAGSATVNGATTVVGTTAINTTGTASTTLGNGTGAVILPGLSTDGFVTNTASGQLGTTSAASLGANFILNQIAQQTGSNFNISGAGTVGGALTAGSASITTNATVGGRLGVGVSSPAGQLANTTSNVLATDGNGISAQGLGWVNTTATGYAGVFYNANNTASSPGLAVKVASPSAAALDVSQGTTAGTAGTSLLRINGDGNMGLGTPIPSQKLDVRGNLRLGADGGNSATGLGQTIEFVGPGFNTDPVGLYRTNTGSDQSELRVVVGDASDANDKFVVGRSSATAEGGLGAGTFTPTFTVRADGSVGIGTSSPAAGLHVDAPESATTTALGVLLSGGSNGNPSIELRGNAKSPYIDFVENTNLDYSTRLISQAGTLNLNYGGTTAAKPTYLLNVDGGITATGQVRANGVVLTSDARFKQNVRPIGSALASVLALRGVRYEWNALGIKHGGTAGASQVGVLAQEVEKIYPELVSTDKDGYKAVNYAQLTPVLIEALKEQQRQIEALKQQTAALKAEATASTDAFEARLRRLEAGSAQAQR